MMAKLNVNLVLHALAVILLGFVVNSQMDIKTGIALARAEREAIVKKIEILEQRVDALEGVLDR